MPRYPGFIGGSYQSLSPVAANERTVNLYVERLENEAAKNKAALYPTPGVQAFVSVSDVGGRGLFGINDRAFAVMGPTLYEFYANGTIISRGAVTLDANPATLSYNGATDNKLFVTSGTNGYILNLTTNALSLVLTGEATMGGMIDAYFLAFNIAESKLRISGVDDGLTWDVLQYTQRSVAPDPWKAMLAADRIGTREIWLIGEQTGEVWYDAGAYPFPFVPIPGALFKAGIVAPFSLAAADDRVIWLAQTAEGAGIVVAAKGYNPTRVSTSAVERAISRYARESRIIDAEALTYQAEGHTFYALTFPTANATWVLDTTTGVWHERGVWNSVTGQYDAWWPRVHCYAFGAHFVAGRGSQAIAVMDEAIGTELDGSGIRRLRRAPALCDEHRQIQFPRLELYMQTGIGNLVTTNPQVMLRWSNDAGQTWQPERQMSAGKMGKTETRVYMNRTGQSRDRVFEVSLSDPVPFRIVDAYLNNTAPRGR